MLLEKRQPLWIDSVDYLDSHTMILSFESDDLFHLHGFRGLGGFGNGNGTVTTYEKNGVIYKIGSSYGSNIHRLV